MKMLLAARSTLITVVKNKKGQALIETLFLLPFIVAVILFAYQAYVLINKNIVAQKYLKNIVVGMAYNRYEITTWVGSSGTPLPPDGKYYFRFAEDGNTKYMQYNLDKSTAELLTAFLTDQGTKKGLVSRLTAGKPAVETLGMCLGGGGLMKDQTSSEVFQLNAGDTCGTK